MPLGTGTDTSHTGLRLVPDLRVVCPYHLMNASPERFQVEGLQTFWALRKIVAISYRLVVRIVI